MCVHLITCIILATTHITNLVWKSYFRLQGLLQQTCVLMQSKGGKRSIKTVHTNAKHTIKMHACAHLVAYIILVTTYVTNLVWKSYFRLQGLLQQTCVLMQNKGEKRSIKTVHTNAKTHNKMYACARLVAYIILATTHITHLVWKSYFRLQGLLQQICVLMQNKGEKRSIKTVRTSATHRIKMHACA